MMFEFLIEYYDEINDKTTMAKGFVPALTMAEATQKISVFYGEENITEIKLKYVGEDSILEIPKDIDIETIADFNKV